MKKRARSKILDNKGFFADIPFIAVFLFIFAIVIIFGHKIYTDFNDNVMSSGMFDSDDTTAVESMTWGQTTINGFDYIFIMSFVLLFGAMVVSAFFLDTHPIFFFITLSLLISFLVVGGILANSFEDITNDSSLSNSTATFPMINYVFDHYILLIFLIMLTGGLVFYAKY